MYDEIYKTYQGFLVQKISLYLGYKMNVFVEGTLVWKNLAFFFANIICRLC